MYIYNILYHYLKNKFFLKQILNVGKKNVLMMINLKKMSKKHIICLFFIYYMGNKYKC